MRYGLRLPLASPRAPSGFIKTAAALSTRTCWSKRCRGSEAISWAWPDLNQRPHPYKRSTAARHADQRFPPGHRRPYRAKRCVLSGLVPSGAGKPGSPTAPVGNSSISPPAVAEAWPADAGTKHDQTGGPGPGRHRTQRRHPRTWPRAQRQPQPLRRAIPTLTGAVLVVNAAWVSSSALLRSAAADAAERCRSAAAAGLSIWVQG
jgi:hypothetical protein